MNSMYDILAKMKQLNENVDPVAFAALAPPKDKITFADKIAGAKKEVDEMLGDVAAEAMKKAVHGMTNEEDMEEGFGDTLAKGFDKFNDATATAGAKLKGLKANITKNPADRQAAIDAHQQIMRKEYKKVRDENPNYRMPSWPSAPSQRFQDAENSVASHRIGLDNNMEEDGLEGLRKAAGVAKKVGKKVLNVVAPDDETLIKDLQKKVGVPQTGKAPGKAGSQQKTEEGNDFTAARLAAIKAGKPTFKLNGKVYRVTGDTSDERKQVDERDYDSRDDFDQHARPGDTVRTEKGTLTKTASGVRHERRHTDDDDSDDHDDTTPKRRGRPKGSKRALGAKGPSGKSKLLNKKSIKEEGKDPEIEAAIKKLEDSGYTVTKKELDEKAVSKKQQKFMGMVHAAQKGEKAASPEVAKVAREMPKKAAKDFASTKHKGLPEKVKAKKDEGKEEVEETTAGSVATAPSADAPKGKKGSMQFGKGVYESRLEESYSQRLKDMLTEGISINASQSEDGSKSLTVTANDEDAVKLSQILQLAGMQQATGYEEACPGCGQSPCGCESVEESLANAPDPQYADTNTMVNDLSGGLNGRKNTGQTTTPVINRDPTRQGVRAVADDLKEQAETRLWDLYKRYERR